MDASAARVGGRLAAVIDGAVIDGAEIVGDGMARLVVPRLVFRNVSFGGMRRAIGHVNLASSTNGEIRITRMSAA
ncbi:hypothetical protein Rrhod_2091 [Rhodococcus rhodnii LMG 5362]|uniref:Uncharacterized protein n=1 Tax=Rhodococcus rhodnii LMG 5362 TaxID=1273125 RepID=R7WMK5_9NOCA|nr:hypothetical protein Rrhod_2091 [Rhodococcus rhodnii LMG 5362]